MLKKSINKEKSLGKILVIVIFISLALMLTLCSKKTTSPDEQLKAPSNLQITLVGDNQIKLTWNDNSTNETKFFIDRKEGEFDWFENYGEVEANITTFPDEIPTTSDTVYSYRVRAFDGNNYSEYSIPAGWFADGTAPTNLQLEQIAQDSIKLIWEDNSIGELNFRVDRKIGDADWQENYKILEPDTTIYIDYNPSLYDTCYYKIFASSGNTSSNCIENDIYPIWLAPSEFKVKILSQTSVKLSWVDNTIDEEGFKIDRKVGTNNWEIEYVKLCENTIEWIDLNVQQFNNYRYRLYSFNSLYTSDTLECSIFIKPSENILYVPDEFSTIQSAINASNNGDTILVSPGTYYENLSFSYNSNNTTVASLFLTTGISDYIEQTIINGNQNGCVASFNGSYYGDEYSCDLIGFTIENGTCGISSTYFNPNIKNVIITMNSGNGFSYYWYSGLKLENVIITQNSGVGFYAADAGNITIKNVTIANNSGSAISGWMGVSIVNCIFWDNSLPSIANDEGTTTINFSNIQGGWEGEGNINSNPQFVNPSLGNYHLSPGSPCIDTGSPSPQYNDPDGSRNDMGAYGGPGGDW